MSEAAAAGLALDMSPELTRAVTNVVCSLCFNSSYCRGDPEFEAMLRYSQGIVDTVAKDSLVDIFPWLQVGLQKIKCLVRTYNVTSAGENRKKNSGT